MNDKSKSPMKSEIINALAILYSLPEFAIKGLEQFDEPQLFFIGSLLTMAYAKGKQDAQPPQGPKGEIYASSF